MLRHGTMEEIGGRVDDIFRLNQLQSLQGLFENAPVRKSDGIRQPQIGTKVDRLFWVLEQGGRFLWGGRGSVPSCGQKLGCRGLAEA